jgi:hypothetical protein
MELEVGAIAQDCNVAVRKHLLDALLCHFHSSTEAINSKQFTEHEYNLPSLSKIRDACENMYRSMFVKPNILVPSCRTQLRIIVGPQPRRVGVVRIAIGPLWLSLSTNSRFSVSSSFRFTNKDADNVDKVYDTSNNTVSNLTLARAVTSQY